MSLLSARFQTIFNVAVAVIFVISLIALPDDMGTWWERLQDIGGMMQDNPLAAVALGASIVLLVLGNLQWLQRVIGMKRWSSDEELGNELHDWLRRARYTITEEPPPPELRNMSFFFVAEQFERKTTILKPSDAPALYIRGRVLPTGEDASTITKMDSAAMTSMIDDIALELARYGVGFKATPNILR